MAAKKPAQKPIAISLGYEWNPDTGRLGSPVVYSENRHVIVWGPTRSGKGVSLEIPNLLMLGGDISTTGKRGISILSIDPKAQNASVTQRWRKKNQQGAVAQSAYRPRPRFLRLQSAYPPRSKLAAFFSARL